MDEKTARDMDRLLAGGKLSGPEADAILDRIHATLEREEKRQRPVRAIRYWAGAALAAAAAALLVVYLPRGPGEQGGDENEEGELGPKLAVRCSGGTLEACPKSSSLVFTLSRGRADGFLSAYAEPVGHDGERVFYFSKEDGSVKLGVAAGGKGDAEHTVRVPAAQRPGRYRIHAVLAERALSRDELLAGAGKPSFEVRVTARVELIVSP